MKNPSGTCCRCGRPVVNGDWIQYCEWRKVLGRYELFHYCELCYEIDRMEFA